MWHVRDQAQEKLIPISVLHIWQLDIRQWGTVSASAIVNLTWPIAMTAYTICGTDYNTTGNGCILSFYDLSNSGCKCRGCRVLDPYKTETFARWIAIGR